jgi:hypothetical protein
MGVVKRGLYLGSGNLVKKAMLCRLFDRWVDFCKVQSHELMLNVLTDCNGKGMAGSGLNVKLLVMRYGSLRYSWVSAFPDKGARKIVVMFSTKLDIYGKVLLFIDV